MKGNNFFYIRIAFLVGSVLWFMPGYTQLQSQNTSSEMKTTSIEPLKPRAPTTPPKSQPPAPIVMPSGPVAGHASYFFPGLIVNRGGSWQGGDNLLNLSSNVGIYFTISKPEDSTLEIDREQMKVACESIFQKANINPKVMAPGGEAPLPFFQFQILIYPIKEGYVASVEGRLFESVSLKRIELEPNMAFQAITWQKSNLIVSPTHKINEQLKLSVENIAETFTGVYQAFERKKSS